MPRRFLSIAPLFFLLEEQELAPAGCREQEPVFDQGYVVEREGKDEQETD